MRSKDWCKVTAVCDSSPLNQRITSITETPTSARLLVLWGILASLIALFATRPALGAPVVWTAPSLERFGPTQAVGTADEINLFAAQGETESFQIIVRAPTGGLTNVNVTPPDFDGPEFTLYREHYVYLSTGSSDWATNRNHPEGQGWYPDALIPFAHPDTGADLSGAALDAVPFSLTAGRNQPIWVDVFIPRGTPPGQYSGPFVVTSDQGNATVTLNLTVWNFQLPLKPAAESSILLWQVRQDSASVREILRHRLMPSSVNVSEERTLIDTFGLNGTDLGFWSGANYTNCLMRSPPSVAELQAAVAQHQPDIHLYSYTADEIDACPNLYESMRSWARNLHAAGIDNLVTMAPVPELYDDGTGTGQSAVDIWVMLPKIYDGAISRVIYCQEKGDQAWSYNCLIQDGYSPKWEIDFAPINYRIQPGFINQSLGMTGILYWRADLWSSDPWNNVEAYAPWFPGEGMIVYPGAQVGLPGVVGSIRAKWMRDGIDDFDYVHLLKEKGLGEWALSIARSVGPDWTNWTRDSNALETARLELGRKLDEIGGDTHYIVAHASTTPTEVGSGGSVQLEAEATDSEGHAITSWEWSDGGAGGTFTPSANVQNPLYSAPINSTDADLVVRLTVRASCGEATGSASCALLVVVSSGLFYDVPDDYWAHDEIMACAEAGIATGFPGNLYRPRWPVTRAQMAVYIARALAGGDEFVPTFEGVQTEFMDISASHWASKHIVYVSNANIVTGYPDGLYHPDWSITRAQMAVFMARAIVDPTGEEGLQYYEPPINATFTDVHTNHWAYKHIEYITDMEITTGYPDGLFRPTVTCTRDQMAAYMARAFGIIYEP